MNPKYSCAIVFPPGTDLTELNKEAKAHIREKIPQSGLMETARHEALEAVLLMEKIVETIGWKLDYEALKLDPQELRFLEDQRVRLN